MQSSWLLRLRSRRTYTPLLVYPVRRTMYDVHYVTYIVGHGSIHPRGENCSQTNRIYWIYIYTFTNGNMTYVTNDVISTCHMSWRITKYHHLTSNDMFIYKSVHPQYTSIVSHVYGTV